MNEENSVIVIDQQEQHKKKGALAVILAIAFVAILGIGGTFAYLTYTTNQTSNRFTTVPGDITADLIEPAWTNALTGSTATASDKTTTIPTAAANMGSGSTVAKNPFVVNTTKLGESGEIQGPKVYVAMKLTFQKWTQATATATGSYTDMDATDMEKLLAVYNIKGSSNTETASVGINVNPTWTKFENANPDSSDATNVRYFYYTKALESMYKTTDGTTDTTVTENTTTDTWGYTLGTGPASASLFDNIIYSSTATNDQIKALNERLGTINPGWKVVVKAAAIQAVDGVQVSSLTKEFKTLLDSEATTPTTATGWRSGKTIPQQ